MKTWKRVLALVLSVLMILGCFTACGGNGDEQKETEPAATVDPAEAKALKVLTLGHSLAVDAGHLLALVAKAEGYEEMTVGTLYYAGCPLDKHVQFLNSNSAEYKLFLSSTTTANEPPVKMENFTMQQAITYDYWDIIVMQGGVFEIADGATYTDGSIEVIQDYVNEHKKNPDAVFMWNMAWAPPVSEGLRKTYNHVPNTYISNYEQFDHDRTKMYAAVTKCVKDHITTDDTFTALIPSGTVFENALSSYLTEVDMHRDYVHATDLSRVMIAYLWYCVLTGVDQLEEIKLDKIPKSFLENYTLYAQGRTLTDNEKALILEVVNNALKNPLQMTQSQYTEAPAGFIPGM